MSTRFINRVGRRRSERFKAFSVTPKRAAYMRAGEPYGRNRKGLKRWLREVKMFGFECGGCEMCLPYDVSAWDVPGAEHYGTDDGCMCGSEDCPECGGAGCSYCGGEGWGIVGTDWDTDDAINGPYDGETETCPNCGGSGRAADMTFW